MHRYSEPKHYLERFMFRAPAAGTGSITIRCLIKQGDTNMGAFYWPTAPASTTPTLSPSNGRSNGDLVLSEAAPPSPPRVWSYRGVPGETCTSVCAARRPVVRRGPADCDDDGGCARYRHIAHFLVPPSIPHNMHGRHTSHEWARRRPLLVP